MTHLPNLAAASRAFSVALLIGVLLTLVACGGIAGSRKAVDFEVTLFSGEEFRMADQVGQNSLVLNFWFPSCPPCRAEMPDFEDAWLELQGQDVRFLGLFVPKGLDSEQDARDFIQELGLTYDIATDVRAEIAEAYELKFYPTTIFIDKSGRVYSTEISVLDQEKITRIVGEMTQG
jgi:peroxiredoxin